MLFNFSYVASFISVSVLLNGSNPLRRSRGDKGNKAVFKEKVMMGRRSLTVVLCQRQEVANGESRSRLRPTLRGDQNMSAILMERFVFP